MKKEDIKKIKDLANTKNVIVDDRLIAFSVVLDTFGDKEFAFKSVFGKQNTLEAIKMANVEGVKLVIDYLGSEERKRKADIEEEKNIKNKILDFSGVDDKVSDEDELTAEENKSAMIAMISRIEEKMETFDIPAKDGLKMITDIRTKLVDKFSMSEERKEQYIYVNTKYNDICPHCGKEIYNGNKDKEQE